MLISLSHSGSSLPRAARTSAPSAGAINWLDELWKCAVEGLMAQIKLSIGGQHITSIITADAVREMRLKRGDKAAALIKSTEVMIVRV